LPADSLRGRVEHQVDIIAGSANKVLLGVVDTSFGVLRSLLPLQGTTGPNPAEGDLQSDAAPWNRPGLGLLRRENGFSIASIAASLPGRDRLGGTAKSIHSVDEESGQQLVVVSSQPPSVKSGVTRKDGELIEESGSSGSEGEDGEDEEDDEDGGDTGHDARSIRSFESMMKDKKRSKKGPRRSLSDRLAHMSGLSKLGQRQQDGQKVSFAIWSSLAACEMLFVCISHRRCSLPTWLPIALTHPFLRGVNPLSHSGLHRPFSDS
jgi:hypothetical protein